MPGDELSRRMGEARFSGPGAPSLRGTPAMGVPIVSAKVKSEALSLMSCGSPFEVEVMLRKKL